MTDLVGYTDHLADTRKHRTISAARTAESILSLSIAVLFGLYFASLIYRYIDMFPLIEYRQWIFHAVGEPLIGDRPFSYLFDLNVDPSHFQIAFSRSMSLWVAILFGHVCGPAPVCNNTLHAAMIVVSMAFLVLSVRALSISRSWFPSVVAGVAVALSVPILDAITWQATLLDKTAMLLTSLTILIASTVKLQDGRLCNVIFLNLLLFVVTFAAYNAKEAALFLTPATVMLVFCRILAAGSTLYNALRRTALLLLLPFTYACLHVAIVFYNRTYLQPGEMSRVTGGNLAFNAEYYTRYILDMLGGSWTVADLEWVATGALLLVFVGLLLDLVAPGRRHVPISFFALFAFAGSLVIPLRTSSTSPFYLLVPIAYFGLLIGLSVDAVIARLPGNGCRLAFASTCTAVLVARVMSLGSALPDFDHLELLSTNFQKTLASVRAASFKAPFDRILFVRPPDEPRAYMYLSAPADNGDYALAPYLDRLDASMPELLRFDAKIKDVSAADAETARRPGDLVVTLGPSLVIDKITRVPADN